MDPTTLKLPDLVDSLSIQDHQPSPAELLPPELWELTFRHLTSTELLSVRLTCRRWRAIVTKSIALLQKFSIRLEGSLVLKRTVNLSNLLPASKVYIGGIRITELDSWWPSLGERLVRLTVDNCEVSLATLIEMLRQAPNLRRLKLNSIESLQSECCDQVVDFRLENLEKLAIGWVRCEGILHFFEQLCPRLKTFHIHGVQMDEVMERKIISFMEVVQDSLEYIAMCPSGSLLEKMLSLKRLKLKRIQFGKCDFSLDQLVEFCRIHRTLEDVCILELHLPTQTLKQIGLHLPALKRLWVTFNQEGTIIPTFLHTMKRLEHLRMYGMNFVEQSIDFTGYESSNLKQLHIFNLPTLQHGFRPFLAKSPRIRCLSLENGTFHRWTQDVFVTLEPLESLEELVLYFIEVDGSSNEAEILSQKQFYSLKSLIITHCKIPTKVLIRWFLLCPKLEELWLTAIDNVNEPVILALIRCLPKLKVLKLASCEDSSESDNVKQELSRRGIELSGEAYF